MRHPAWMSKKKHVIFLWEEKTRGCVYIAPTDALLFAANLSTFGSQMSVVCQYAPTCPSPSTSSPQWRSRKLFVCHANYSIYSRSHASFFLIAHIIPITSKYPVSCASPIHGRDVVVRKEQKTKPCATRQILQIAQSLIDLKMDFNSNVRRNKVPKHVKTIGGTRSGSFAAVGKQKLRFYFLFLLNDKSVGINCAPVCELAEGTLWMNNEHPNRRTNESNKGRARQALGTKM